MSEYLKRIHRRLMERAARADDENWKTINGTHVLFGEGGEITKGPEALKRAVGSATASGKKSYSPKRKIESASSSGPKHITTKYRGAQTSLSVKKSRDDKVWGTIYEAKAPGGETVTVSQDGHILSYEGGFDAYDKMMGNEKKGAERAAGRARAAEKKTAPKEIIFSNHRTYDPRVGQEVGERSHAQVVDKLPEKTNRFSNGYAYVGSIEQGGQTYEIYNDRDGHDQFSYYAVPKGRKAQGT